MNSGVKIIENVGELTWYGRPPLMDGSEDILVGYSSRNKMFTREYFKNVQEMQKKYFKFLYVAIMDVPYAYNEAAELGKDKPDMQMIKKAITIGDERERMVKKVLKVNDKEKKWKILRWWSIEDENVLKIREEFRKAIVGNERLRENLIKYAIEWLHKKGRVDPENFLEFQIQEIPILINIYYNYGYLIDVYPGKPFEFYFSLEQGEWSNIMPLATKMTLGKELCFISAEELI